MSETYQPHAIEVKWQHKWEATELYRSKVDWDKPKHYALTMLPYPSGDLHIGHWFAMTPSDARARWMRMRGYNVPLPRWDSTPSACPPSKLRSRAISIPGSGPTPISSACASSCEAWAPCSIGSARPSPARPNTTSGRSGSSNASMSMGSLIAARRWSTGQSRCRPCWRTSRSSTAKTSAPVSRWCKR